MNYSTTRTGAFGIGFRRGWSDWQRDDAAIADFANTEGFACVDVGPDAHGLADCLVDAGLSVGTVDLPDWKDLISPSAEDRKAAIDKVAAHLRTWSRLGKLPHFCVMLPKDPSRERAENFDYMVESFSELSPVFEETGATLVIEGWPGPGALCCAPESLRAFFAECPSPALGINYDPSHLIRMGIDPIRFVREFAGRIFHVHGKDTEVFSENLYEVGHEIGADHLAGHGFGAHAWRYTIPGHGCMRWVTALQILRDSGFKGKITVELEDENFNGSEAGEQAGLRFSRDFLQGC